MTPRDLYPGIVVAMNQKYNLDFTHFIEGRYPIFITHSGFAFSWMIIDPDKARLAPK
jgi:hypothetical protein